MPENSYSQNSPVIARAGALLKDNETSSVLIQLKLENITEQIIKSLKIKLSIFDIEGKAIQTDIEHQYFNLSAGYGDTFGQNTPVVINNFSACKFEITEMIVMSDNSTWTSTQKYISVPTQESFLLNISDTQLFNKFISEINHNIFWEKHQNEKVQINNALTKLRTHKASNPEAATEKINTYTSILHAPRKADSEFNPDETFLISDIENMLNIFESGKKEYKKEKAKKRKSRVLIILGIILLSIVLLIAGGIFLLINTGYNTAVANLNNENYESAIADFEILGSFKDSEEKLLEAKFGLAEKMEEISVAEAYAQYSRLPSDYPGVSDKLKQLEEYTTFIQEYTLESISVTNGLGDTLDPTNGYNAKNKITLNLCIKDGKLCYAPDALTKYNNANGTFTYEYSEFSESEDAEYSYYCEYDEGFGEDHFVYLSANAIKIIYQDLSLVSDEKTVITEVIYAK